MRFTYFRSEPRRLHARSPRSSASRGASAPSALQGPFRSRNRDRDDDRARLLADREPARWFSSPTKRVASRSTRPETFPGPGRQPGHAAHHEPRRASPEEESGAPVQALPLPRSSPKAELTPAFPVLDRAARERTPTRSRLHDAFRESATPLPFVPTSPNRE